MDHSCPLYSIFAGMQHLISWLERNKLLTAGLAVAFYLSVVVFHDEVTRVAILIRRSLGLEGYNLLFLVVSVIFMLTLLTYTLKKLKKSERRWFKTILLVITLLFIVIFFRFALVYNIEAVHFGQYFILAILIFPLLKSYGDTVYWVTVLGTLDEIYQYTILTPTFNYFDFNDIILNLLGAGLGVVFILITTGYESKKAPLWKRTPFWFTLCLFIVLIILGSVGEFTLYPINPDNGDPLIVLNRKLIPDGFWTSPYPGRVYHILRPLEGIILIFSLFLFYYMMDWGHLRRRAMDEI